MPKHILQEQPLWPVQSLLNELEIERLGTLLAKMDPNDPSESFVRLQLNAAIDHREEGEINASNWHLRLVNRKMNWSGWV